MEGLKNGSVSKDFPLFHSNVIPIHVSYDEKHHTHKKSKDTFIYTNEHPDIFRIDGMKEGGYKNPYLEEVIKVDRSKQFKKLDFNRKQLNFLDFIKSNRQYSQDPKILRYIAKASDLEIHNKREQIKRDREKALISNSVDRYKCIETEPSLDNRRQILRSLDGHIPRMDYKMKGTINLETPEQDKANNTITCDERSNLKKYRFFFDPRKSSYLCNSNDYKISEAQQRDLNMEINYLRRPVFKYNLIKDKVERFNPPPYRGDNWGAFMENYFTLFNDPQKFRKKGGLFSEFSDKNINVININKSDIHKKLQEEKELKKRFEGVKKNIN